jgi:serine/threonine protein kinase
MDGGDLDEFRLVRPLGRGGMGEVYLGHDTVLDRPVAIKLIGSRNPDAASRERFVIEARAIARLSHPNVITIYRVGTTGDGRPFLVQELIRGRSLDRIARPVPPRRLCELAVGIARGLDAAHRRGILHRDVKPANVMLDEQDTVRLLDFGLAKLTAVEAPVLGGIRGVAQSLRRERCDARAKAPACGADHPDVANCDLLLSRTLCSRALRVRPQARRPARALVPPPRVHLCWYGTPLPAH